MPSAQGNPPWDKAEIILALDLYLNHESATKHGSVAEIESLSATLRSVGRHDLVADPDRFRNPNGVATKLANLQYLDPDDEAKGLSGASQLDREVWGQYHDKPELVHQIAESIRSSLAGNPNEDLELSPIDDQEAEFPEGRYLYRMHVMRERNPKAVRAVKQEAEKRGELRCCICGFDFYRVYGDLGKGYIECHHTKPISEYRRGDTTRAEDLTLVCPNCHRMLHRHKPLLMPEELKEIIRHSELPIE